MLCLKKHSRQFPCRDSVGCQSKRGAVLVAVLLVVVVLSGSIGYLAKAAVLQMQYRNHRAIQRCLKQAMLTHATAITAKQAISKPRYRNSDVAWMGEHVQVIATPYEFNSDGRPSQSLTDESGKLNLNSLLALARHPEEPKQRLLRIPGITDPISDAILDWLDADDDPRPNGAEKNYYSSRGLPQFPPNTQFLHETDLLAVKGIDQTLLLGEDANGNGWLDENENDGSKSFPPDNEDGVLNRGLLSYFTVSSADRSHGKKPGSIELNAPNLVTLHDRIADRLGDDAALFLTALRLHGPSNWDAVSQLTADTVDQRIRTQLSSVRNPALAPVNYRQGLRINSDGVFHLSSLFDLLKTEVTCIVGNEDKVLVSPWPENGESLASAIRRLEALFTVRGNANARINLSTASLNVLKTIPGIADEQVRHIWSRRPDESGSEYSLEWLAELPLLAVADLRTLGRYGCGAGSIYGGHLIACHSQYGNAAVAKVLLATRVNRSSLLSYQLLPGISKSAVQK
jgi:type II secretory pathway component PulK